MDGGLMIYGAKKPNGTSSRQVVWSRNNNVDVVLCFSIRVFVRQPVNMTSSLDTRPVPAWAPSSSKSFIMAHVCFTLRCLLVASPPAGYPSKGSECGVWVADNALIADFWIAESNAHNETALQSSESELEHVLAGASKLQVLIHRPQMLMTETHVLQKPNKQSTFLASTRAVRQFIEMIFPEVDESPDTGNIPLFLDAEREHPLQNGRF
ncbi:hypothetical protein IWX90DRAFT_481333 [Phyllosticta citrichinensis]|uniref:Uncharacterized protein n=1 Tax=Phyllosticta citrichinensis TaxID=1130410 RepID=A0ABR1XGG9_9PEZI